MKKQSWQDYCMGALVWVGMVVLWYVIISAFFA